MKPAGSFLLGNRDLILALLNSIGPSEKQPCKIKREFVMYLSREKL